MNQLSRVARWRGAFFEPVAVPYRTFAAIISHLEILSELQRVGGTSIFAQSAEHAARGVVGEKRQNFSPCGVVSLPANHDQVFRARERAQIACDTQRLSGFWVLVQARRTTVTFRHHGAFERVLLGVNVARKLRPERDAHTLQKICLEYPGNQFLHVLSLLPQWAVVKDSHPAIASHRQDSTQ
jgi:hypothetical protein